MPIHDWTHVRAGLFHHFHQDWSIEIARALNRDALPSDFSALVEQHVGGPEPDVIAVELESASQKTREGGTVATMEAPRTRLVRTISDEASHYAAKANRISIRHALGDVVAVIEIVSPGNKSSRGALRSLIEKSVELLRSGVHLLVVDLFPPSDRDPQGIHPLISDEFTAEEFELPAGTQLTFVSYHAADELTAYIEPVAVGDEVPDMPLFLTRKLHVTAPLAATYQATWEACPAAVRELVEAAEPG